MMRRSALILAAFCAILCAAIVSGAVGAASADLEAKPETRDVCPGLCAYSSIQAAIDASADGDTIRVAGSPGSAYAERLVVTRTVHILGGYSGPPAWQRNITTYSTIINGQGVGVVVHISAGAATVEGFTITGGYSDFDGGGILIEGASPLISATTVISNIASSSGGGVAIHGGTPQLVSNLIMSNTAMGGGGVLVADGAGVEMRNTTIANNQGYLFGGGMLVVNAAAPQLDGCVIRGNRAPSGGGVHAFDSMGAIVNSDITDNAAQSGYGGGLNLKTASMTISGSRILSNTASLDGGGIEFEDSFISLDSSTLQGNHARSGGGIYVVGSLGVLSGNTVAGNSADSGSGGGIALDRSAPTLDGNTVLSNSAALNGGGIEITGNYCPEEDCTNPAYPTIVNTIIARNQADGKGGGIHIDTGTGPDLTNNTVVANSLEGIFVDAYAQVSIINTIVVSNGLGIRALDPSAPMADYNLVWGNNVAGDYDGSAAGLHGPHDISVDPQFVAAAANDFHLSASSPAIDAGTNSGAPGSDRDGNVRPLIGHCSGQQIADIGAYEYLLPPAACATPSPTPTSTTTPSTSPTATRTQTASATATPVATGTATRTQTPGQTATRTLTPSVTATRTVTASPTRTATHTLTGTPTRTATRTATVPPASTATPTQTATPSATATATPVLYYVYLPVVSSTFLPECAVHEPNDSMNAAWGPLIMAMQYRSYLCAYDAVDWYYIDVPRAGAVAVDLVVPERADLSLSLHSADGASIAQSENVGEGVAEHIITVVQSAGRYYVRVTPYTRRDATQPYDLTANFF